MNKNMYVTRTLIDDVEHSEVDIDLHDEFGFDYESGESFVVIEHGHGDADGYVTSIDRMIKTLQEMKDKGATHVGMNYHCDHIGYEISGYNVRISTQAEIDVYLGEISEMGAKQKKLNALYAEIAKIKTS